MNGEMTMQKIIEFVGVPCCGKSTLSHQVAEELKKSECVDETQFFLSHSTSHAQRAFLKIVFCIAYFFCHPIRMINLVWRRYSLSLLMNYAYISWICRKRKTIVLEQGLCQLIMAFYENHDFKDESILSKLIDLNVANKNRLVVFVDVTAGDVKERILLRGENDQPIIARSPDVGKAIAQSMEMFEALWGELNHTETCRVIRVNNRKGMTKEAVNQIIKAVREW